MLQHGAEKVYAVDVGHDQLAPTLRADPRVLCWEGTDIRNVNLAQLGKPADFFLWMFPLFLWNMCCRLRPRCWHPAEWLLF